jgi:hypothetical protein
MAPEKITEKLKTQTHDFDMKEIVILSLRTRTPEIRPPGSPELAYISTASQSCLLSIEGVDLPDAEQH